MTARDPIKLRDAPARFLNTAWLRLMELKGSDAKAVETLSHPDPGTLVYRRRQVIAAGRGGPDAQAEEDIYALAEKMIASFREIGASGQIIGHGIHSWTGLRQPIPPEFRPDLRCDFEANKASAKRTCRIRQWLYGEGVQRSLYGLPTPERTPEGLRKINK